MYNASLKILTLPTCNGDKVTDCWYCCWQKSNGSDTYYCGGLVQ